ncbi:MAG: hypothetical protein JWM11_2591, partial [Planctomycetaceae bacterium]|nr:hypothetical protein [Planctomycetaceae bacterium]
FSSSSSDSFPRGLGLQIVGTGTGTGVAGVRRRGVMGDNGVTLPKSEIMAIHNPSRNCALERTVFADRPPPSSGAGHGIIATTEIGIPFCTERRVCIQLDTKFSMMSFDLN